MGREKIIDQDTMTNQIWNPNQEIPGLKSRDLNRAMSEWENLNIFFIAFSLFLEKYLRFKLYSQLHARLLTFLLLKKIQGSIFQEKLFARLLKQTVVSSLINNVIFYLLYDDQHFSLNTLLLVNLLSYFYCSKNSLNGSASLFKK